MQRLRWRGRVDDAAHPPVSDAFWRRFRRLRGQVDEHHLRRQVRHDERDQIYDPQLDLTNVDKIHFACTFDNTTTHDIIYGIGSNEMCILFGYVYPVKKQFVGHSPYAGEPCTSFEIGLFR